MNKVERLEVELLYLIAERNSNTESMSGLCWNDKKDFRLKDEIHKKIKEIEEAKK